LADPAVQQILLLSLAGRQPTLARLRLALGAMPISARVDCLPEAFPIKASDHPDKSG